MNQRRNLLKITILLTSFIYTTLQGCLHNQYLDIATGQCVNCQNNCDQCANSYNNCTACITGFYLANSTCISCPPQCYSCKSTSFCTICKQNYYLSGYSCLSCGKNCMQCNSVSCNVCQAGYEISNNCLSCSKQFFLNLTQNTCDMCPLGCLDCSNKTSCTKCDINYVLIKNLCQYTGVYQQSSQSESRDNQAQSSNKSIFFIILGVLVAFVVVSCIACSIYYCIRNKRRKITKEGDIKNIKLVNRVSNTTLNVDKDSIIQPQNQVCHICKKRQAELSSSCGHFFHKRCYQSAEERCPVCPQDFSVAETYFQQSKNKQIELQSEYSVKRPQQKESQKGQTRMAQEISSLQ